MVGVSVDGGNGGDRNADVPIVEQDAFKRGEDDSGILRLDVGIKQVTEEIEACVTARTSRPGWRN
jgi:hypothetical protein